jgi:hypothetical protein
VVAKRTDVKPLAGESTYAELGIDAGVVGLVAFVVWSLALLLVLVRREAWLAAALWGAAGIAISGSAPVVEAEPRPPIAAATTAGERPPVEQAE